MVRLQGMPRAPNNESIAALRIIAGFPADSFDGEIWRIGWKHLRTEAIGKIGEVFLPLRPIPVAFAFNTLVYAAVLWLLIPGPFVLRRFIRVKRGRCVKCGYPMGESAVCSECGSALRRRVGA